MGGRFGIRRVGPRILAASLRHLGRLAIAESFVAPAELAAISLPPPPLDLGGGPTRVLLIDAKDGSYRTALPKAIPPGMELPFGFAAFANPDGAIFLLFLFRPAASGPVTARAWQSRVARRLLVARPPITVRCNDQVNGFLGFSVPPRPPHAMHLLDVGARTAWGNAAVRGAVEACWQEDGGCYAQGWLHAYERRVLGVSVLGSGTPIAIESLTPRPDLRRHFPMLPEGTVNAGFAVFLPGHAGAEMEFRVETEAGLARVSLPLPEVRMPVAADLDRETVEKEQAFGRFVTEVNERSLEVLEIGSRLVGSRTEALSGRFPHAKRFVGMDIHPGPTVDVVGDVHQLSDLVGPRTFDAVLSGAVLEHLAMPWLVAAEINRVLRPGGLAYHIAPQAWPVHEEPNDFWRFTDEALKLLFGERFGFEVLSAGMADRVRLYPLDKRMGDLGLPFGYGYGSAWVLARKVREMDEVAPASDVLAALSRRYPVPAG
jgi:SAM-dependent methyltransferase